MRILVALASTLAVVAGHSNTRCFVTNDWRLGAIVPNEPNILIWEPGGPNRDVLLSDLGTEAEFAGVIARNVSQGSVFWIPPRNITKGNPDQLFAIQLFDLESGNGCSSPAFKFPKIDNANDKITAVPYGPFVTTIVSILNAGYITATATVASFQSDQPRFEQPMIGSITATDEAITSGTFTSLPPSSPASKSDKDNKDSGLNVLAIVIGTIGGVLIATLIVLCVRLWRTRRKRASEEVRAKSLSDLGDTSPLSFNETQLSEVDAWQVATEVSGTARHEVMGDSSAPQELPSRNMNPVELPAEEIQPPTYPGHRESEVSPTTGASRRSSLSFDKGIFTVLPMSGRRDRKEWPT